MCLLEDNVLEQRLGADVLLFDDALAVHRLTYHDALRLGCEEDATAGDGRGVDLLGLGDADAGESHLEDADAVDLHFLSELEEVLHGLAQFLEHGLDVRLLDRALCLDELAQLLGADEVDVVDGLGVVLAERLRILDLVLCLNEFLTHFTLKIKH